MSLLIILLFWTSVVVGDWPQYLQNSQHSSFIPYSNQSIWCPADTLWRDTNTDVWNIISSGDVLYTVSLDISGDSIAARDAQSYNLKWESNFPRLRTVPVFSSVTSLLYVATDDHLYALNITTGAVQWSSVIASPVPTYLILHKDLIIVSVNDFTTPHILAFYDAYQPKIALNISMPDICLEMVASPNDVLYTLISETLTSFSISAINLTNGEFIWSNKTVYVPNWFDFISLSNGNLVLNSGDSFTIFEETTGNIVLNKPNFVIRGASSDFLYALNVTELNGRFEVFADGVVKMDYNGNVVERFDFDMILTSVRIVLDGDKVFYVGGQGQNEGRAYFFAYDTVTTDKLWTYTEFDINAVPSKHIQLIINDGNVIATISYQVIFSLASCGSHGSCNVDTRICECNNAWHGDSCGICNNNCSLHGSCNEEGNCVCDGNWLGDDCDTCAENWGGENCTVCTKDCGHGTCDASGVCVCDKNWHTSYHGENCTDSKMRGGPIALIVLAVVIVVAGVVIGVKKFRSRNKATYEVIY